MGARGRSVLVEVPQAKPATLDLKLEKTKDLSLQLTSLDWISIMPGTPEQKAKLVYKGASCNYCHQYRRILRSKHDAAEFARVIKRMKTYYPDGTASSDDGRGKADLWKRYGDSYGKPTPEPSRQPDLEGPNWSGVPITEYAEYLATANLSGGRTTWPFELRATMPRPKGAGTRIIITQWDQPRKLTVSHDMDVDSKGSLWYGDESNQFIGMLEPRTNTFTEYPLPELPADHLHGTRDVQVDQEDNIWFPMRVQGGAALVTKFEPKTKKLTIVDGATAQFLALGPNGKLWTGGAGNTPGVIDIKTMKMEARYQGNGYQLVVSSKGIPYMGSGGAINIYDVPAGKLRSVPLPSQNPMARRGRMDAQDRYWFGEYNGDKIGMFDTKTETVKEWPLRQYSTPYTASVPDKNGYVYAPSNMSDRLSRLDPKTGNVVEYLMPTEFDTKKIVMDPSTNRVVLWMANTRNARVLRVEPLD